MRALLAAIAFAGCAGVATLPPDAAAKLDGGSVDAGVPVDAGLPGDAGLAGDAGIPDAGAPFDAGPRVDAGAADAGPSPDAGPAFDASVTTDGGLPSWVPTSLFEAARVPFTNRLDDVDLVGVWSGDSAAHFGSYSGGVYASAWGPWGGHVIHGGGHAANDDNSIFVADYNDLTFKRIGGPTQLPTVAAYNAAITVAPDDLSNPREYAPSEPGSAHTSLTRGEPQRRWPRRPTRSATVARRHGRASRLAERLPAGGPSRW
jgi:hypothetical protein